MSTVTLSLPANVLYQKPQELKFEKIATFIGGNGSGKSTILKSIFDEKLKGTTYEDYKIVCFSSGQNESYSKHFGDYLGAERAKKNALNLDCFYYDKLWSMLIVFLATTSKHDGLVRSFLKKKSYITENELDADESTLLSFKVKVDKGYTNIVKQALEDETKGDSDVITNKAYHRTLQSFIHSLIDDGYDFSQPLEHQNIKLTQDELSKVSFEGDESESFDPKVMFFTQAADNDYFIIKDSFELNFMNGDSSLSLGDLSDGEYQILFLYALIDIFDTEMTLFLLDEADSHLHYKNIESLWDTFCNIKGLVITTTHLIDSITKSGLERLRVIEDGLIKPGNNLRHLTERLGDLTEINNVKFQAISLFKNVVLIDDENDWEQFKLLAIRKLSSSLEEQLKIESKLSNFIAIKCNSGYQGKQNEVFADKKILWLDNFSEYLSGHPHKTKNIFLICDRDEFSLGNVGTGKCRLLLQGKSVNKISANLTSHTLCWKRREIKHYLLSHTALIDNIDAINDELDLSNKAKLLEGSSGDYKTDGNFNEQLAKLKSKPVKDIVDKHINDDDGFCFDKARSYIARIPKEEISGDIVDMYNYLVGENE
ncbi:AAA family ATPase [Photobacterium sanguinicancri]|uniref:AAA family ATPase n=1 Tax=Photobacterium sanguinicancri TaxID=875932 RepID=A0AAW7Y3T4_9GAMM|nr:AAA family ATPase [Photobacterium sanguinicancri]MDO6543248.1 AAA family ATPase [Photobacterium sanguinicancri]